MCIIVMIIISYKNHQEKLNNWCRKTQGSSWDYL